MMDQPAAPRAMFAPPGENRLRPMSEIQNLALISASLTDVLSNNFDVHLIHLKPPFLLW
jgi:hypothetical protein